MAIKTVIITFSIIIAFSGDVFAGEVAAPLAAAAPAPAAVGYANTIPYNVPPFAGRTDVFIRGLSAAPAPLVAAPAAHPAPFAAAPLAAAPGLFSAGLYGPSSALPYAGAPAYLSGGPGLFGAASPYAGFFTPGLYSGLASALAYNGALSPYAAAPIPGTPFIKK
ncbi:cuticle protein 19.8-like [Chrysoperla carnea]|uniref:cuticle protein 19.8-like n=1 Tax=Chrysoperla carnea TaxID=189513 RepID=UPI001D08A41D|nr:cuticle protein 19.8-like [Chrysoperla carnea]